MVNLNKYIEQRENIYMDIQYAIQGAMNKKGWDKHALAKEMGCHVSFIETFQSDEGVKHVKLVILISMMIALNLKLEITDKN